MMRFILSKDYRTLRLAPRQPILISPVLMALIWLDKGMSHQQPRKSAMSRINSTEQSAIAVIADAHCHDMGSDYGLKASPLADQSAAVRSWQDSRRASRLFNESAAALRTALDDVQRRGIRHVILLGDYTDDGQAEAAARLRSVLFEYQQRASMAFYAIPGNHDGYGPQGKHQSTRFVSQPGETVLVSSDPAIAATESNAVLTTAMYCPGTPTALQSMAEFGLFPQADYLHWETPFGFAPAIEARQYIARSADGQVARSLTDASYLVEPIAGLWLLMIDANVFEPRNGQWRETQKKAFLDCSDAGWNSLLRNRTHLLPWIKDVCQRASTLGKQLIGFSHYPLMDPFDDQSDSEERLFGQSEMRRRRPSKAVAQALLETGLRLHFGGHLHVNGRRRLQQGRQCLNDIAVPSTAAFPAAFQVIHRQHNSLQLETVPLNDMCLNTELLDYYQAELQAMKQPPDEALSARDYGEFHYRRMYCRVMAHHLPREWPADLAAAVRDSHAAKLAAFLLSHRPPAQTSQDTLYSGLRAGDSALSLQRLCDQAQLSVAELQACTLPRLITDWYCLRQAGHQAGHFFEANHLRIYHFLAEHFGDLTPTSDHAQVAFLQIFLGRLQQFLQRSTPGDELTIRLD